MIRYIIASLLALALLGPAAMASDRRQESDSRARPVSAVYYYSEWDEGESVTLVRDDRRRQRHPAFRRRHPSIHHYRALPRHSPSSRLRVRPRHHTGIMPRHPRTTIIVPSPHFRLHGHVCVPSGLCCLPSFHHPHYRHHHVW